MGSIAARQVAEKVLETIGRGEKPSVRKIAPKFGYSETTADSGQIQQTKTYQKTIAPVIKQLEIERNRAIKAMKGKISKAKYRDLVDSTDKLTKNIQLLNGGKTSNEGMVISWE